MDLTCLLRNRAVALCSAALLLSIGSHARADAPALLPVHGFLTDAEGTPETGKHRLTFFLYEDETGGTPLYTDDYASIEVNAGQFIVYLGSGDDADGQSHQPFSFWICAHFSSTSEMPPTLKKACSATWSNSPLAIASNDSTVSLSGTVEPSTPVNFFAM